MPRIHVEAWDPDFGSAFPSGETTLSRAEVDASIEIPARRWKPIPLERRSPAAKRLVFVDGVRRVDALVWIEEADGSLRRGLCASYAAGAVTASLDGRAAVSDLVVRRGLFSLSSGLEPLGTDAGMFPPVTAAGDSPLALSSELQEQLRRLEAEVALSARAFDLLVVDGPLSTHHVRERVVGYVKTHRVSYLSPEEESVIQNLEPFERTPLFRTTTSWTRLSCYLRVGGERTHPFSGIVRLELSADAPFEESRRVATIAAASLPRYASVPHKDPRAPQNLFPIGALERELRRRLGDQALVHRALKVAARKSVE